MKKYSLLVGVLCIVVAISACGMKSVRQGADIDEAKVKKSIIDGKTTKAEVMLEFGTPTKTMDNDKMYFYTWT
ncbi:MAG TPA: hypothetical protein VLZ07_03785, partial [Syntrophales bacterium]|nr:hypothetical protein [Syntrophales bacterium]